MDLDQEYEFTPRDPEATNVVLKREGFWISYNDFDFSRFGLSVAISIPPETAICVEAESAEDTEFHILKGDHRAEYVAILRATAPEQQLAACMAYYQTELATHGS